MSRQEMQVEKSSVTMLVALKWFDSDITSKGKASELVKGVFEETSPGQKINKVVTENELMTLCYLHYLESNDYLSTDKRFLFFDLFKRTRQTEYQEQVFLFLEMLKVLFPGGDQLIPPASLHPIFSSFQLCPLDNPDQDSIRLLSRIFCLFSFEEAGVQLKADQSGSIQRLDFEIAQFCSLLEFLKLAFRSSFQMTLFRAFIQGRSSILNSLKALKKLSFKKSESGGLVGLLLKSILTRQSLTAKDPSGLSLKDEFPMLNKS